MRNCYIDDNITSDRWLRLLSRVVIQETILTISQRMYGISGFGSGVLDAKMDHADALVIEIGTLCRSLLPVPRLDDDFLSENGGKDGLARCASAMAG